MVEKHVERILSLESALRQRDNSLQKLNMQMHNKDMQYLQLHAGPDAHSESRLQGLRICICTSAVGLVPYGCMDQMRTLIYAGGEISIGSLADSVGLPT